MLLAKICLFAAALTIVLVGCSLPLSEMPVTASPSLLQLGSPTAVSSLIPESSVQPLAVTLTPTITSLATPTKALVEAVLTPEIESTAPQICSPLSIHPLSELPGIISDPYRPPPPGKEQRHHGVDFSYYRHGERQTIRGVGVQTVLPGVVSTALAETFPYGNIVIVETSYATLPENWLDTLHIPPGNSIYTLYAHMELAPQVTQGGQVDACHPLGEVGSSGNAVEPHLHLEMRLGAPGARFNSLGFYKADDTEEERSNYVRWRTSGEFQHFDPMLVLSGPVGEAGSGE